MSHDESVAFEQLRASLEASQLVRFDKYAYFVHPLADGVPAIVPDDLDGAAALLAARVPPGVDGLVTVEAMGIPLAVAVSLRLRLPLTIIRKRRYGLPGEQEVGQATGYAKGALFVNGLAAGQRVCLIDDVISTGGTHAPLLRALTDQGVDVAALLVLVEKGDGLRRVRAATPVPVTALFRLDIDSQGVIHVSRSADRKTGLI